MMIAKLIMIYVSLMFLGICIWISLSKFGTKLFLLFIPVALGLCYIWIATLWDGY